MLDILEINELERVTKELVDADVTLHEIRRLAISDFSRGVLSF